MFSQLINVRILQPSIIYGYMYEKLYTLYFQCIISRVATTVDISTTIEIIISIVVKNALKNKHQSQSLLYGDIFLVS